MSSLSLRIAGDLVEEARRSGEAFHRSISQQVEYWASLGQRLEAVISTPGIARLKGLNPVDVDQAMTRATGNTGRRRMLAYLDKTQGTSYGVKPDRPNTLIEYRKATKPTGRGAAMPAGSKKAKAVAAKG